MDIQANGGLGFSFNDLELMEREFGIKNPIWQIEKAHLLLGNNCIFPTFTTDSDENIEKLMGYVAKRIANKKLPTLSAIHLEGNFITRCGAHNKKLIRSKTKKDVASFISAIEKPFIKSGLMEKNGNFPIKICMTIAPDFFFVLDKLSKDLTDEFVKLQNRGIVLFAGHTDTDSKKFLKVQSYMQNKNAKGFVGISHIQNAMLGGHFKRDESGNYLGLNEYLMNHDNDNLLATIIMDGVHVRSKLDLIPTFLLFADRKKMQKLFNENLTRDARRELQKSTAKSITERIIFVSDCASITGLNFKEGFTAVMTGKAATVHINGNGIPSFSWHDYTRGSKEQIELLVKELEFELKLTKKEILENIENKNQEIIDKVVELLADWQISGKGKKFCYDNLSASAVSHKDCVKFFRSKKWINDWTDEVRKNKNSESWRICEDILRKKFGIDLNNKKEVQESIKVILEFLTKEENLEKMVKQNVMKIFNLKKDCTQKNTGKEKMNIYKNECRAISKKVKQKRKSNTEKVLRKNMKDQLFHGISGYGSLIGKLIA